MDSPKVPGGPGWLALAVLLHGLLHLLLVPAWSGEDEPWHVDHARAHAAPTRAATEEELALLSPSQAALHERTGADPAALVRNQRELVASMRRRGLWMRVDFIGWEHGADDLDHVVPGHDEAGQPALYYRLAGGLLRALALDDVEAELLALRVTSLLAYLVVVLITHALARLALDDPWSVLLATVLCAWLPLHARQAALVTNDALVRPLTALALLLAALVLHGRARAATLTGALGAAALALATKATAIGGGLASTAFALGALPRAGTRGARLGAGLVGGLAVALAALALLRAADGGGALPGREEFLRGLGFVLAGDFWAELARTLAGTYRWERSSLPSPLPGLLAGGLLALVALSLPALARERSRARRAVLGLCWLAIVAQVAAMALRGFAAARYLLPVLPALAVLVGAGSVALLPPRLRPAGTAALVVLLVTLDGVGLWAGLVGQELLEPGS